MIYCCWDHMIWEASAMKQMEICRLSVNGGRPNGRERETRALLDSQASLGALSSDSDCIIMIVFMGPS